MLRLTVSSLRAIGPVLAGVLVALIGSPALLAWDGMSFLVASAVLMFLRVELPSKERVPLLRSLADGWALFVSRRWLWTCTLVMTVGGMAWLGGFQLLGPVVSTGRGGSAFSGAVASAYAAGLVCGGLVMLAWRPRRSLVAANLGSVALCLPLLGLALA